MDIRYLSRRNHHHAAQSGGAKQAQPTAAPAEVAEAAEAAEATEAAADGSARQPAAMPHFSRAGRLLNVLQSFEQRHPDETKKILGNIADKLRSDAEHAGVWGSRLERWADRFQQAADTGDLSNLLPRLQPAGHFGMRAYQQAQQAAEPEADAMVADVADAALAQSSASAAEIAASTEASSDAGEADALASVEVADLESSLPSEISAQSANAAEPSSMSPDTVPVP